MTAHAFVVIFATSIDKYASAAAANFLYQSHHGVSSNRLQGPNRQLTDSSVPPQPSLGGSSSNCTIPASPLSGAWTWTRCLISCRLTVTLERQPPAHEVQCASQLGYGAQSLSCNCTDTHACNIYAPANHTVSNRVLVGGGCGL